jgi:hypothetical protein
MKHVNTEFEKVTIKATNPWFPYESIWPRWLRYLEFIIRVKVFKQSSYLIDKWTIEESGEIETIHGIDLEEELAKALIEEINKEIAENGSYTWKELCEMEKRKQDNGE